MEVASLSHHKQLLLSCDGSTGDESQLFCDVYYRLFNRNTSLGSTNRRDSPSWQPTYTVLCRVGRDGRAISSVVVTLTPTVGHRSHGVG